MSIVLLFSATATFPTPGADKSGRNGGVRGGGVVSTPPGVGERQEVRSDLSTSH